MTLTLAPHLGAATQAGTPAIGLFDSGLGGLSVLAAVRALLPQHDLIYYADTARFPYGDRPAAEVVEIAAAATRALVRRGAGAVVVACNTATTAALAALRHRFPLPLIGIEPALKPAALQTRVGRVALLATAGTVAAPALRRLIERHAADVDVRLVPAPALAARIERGDLDSAGTLALLDRYLQPVQRSGADVLVLGCTHYAFLRPAIERRLGGAVVVLEPSEAVARQVARVAGGAGTVEGREGRIQYLTSGDPVRMRQTLDRLRAAGFDVPAGAICWEGEASDLL